MAEIHKHSIVYKKGMANPELVLKQVTEQLSSRREVSKIKHIWDGNILFLKLLVNNELYKSKITITDSSIDIEYVGL